MFLQTRKTAQAVFQAHAWARPCRLARVLTLPAAMLIAGSLYVILRQIF